MIEISILNMGLIDLDVTFLVQLFLFLIFTISLSKIIFKPYIEFIEKRDETLNELKEKGEKVLEEAEERVLFYEEEMKKAIDEGIKIRLALKNKGFEEREIILKKTREECEKIYNEKVKELDREIEEIKIQIDEKIMYFKDKILTNFTGVQ